MEGLGNDYIYIDISRFPVDNPSELSIKLSDRHYGIGADGIILIGPSDNADFSMRIFNADGSEGLMCGNGARCVGKYLYDKHLADKTTLTLETLSGVRTLNLNIKDNVVESVTVDMGMYLLTDAPSAIVSAGRTFKGTGISVGNPHYVIFTDDAEVLDLSAYGPEIENNPVFPDRTNVEFAIVTAPDTIRMRVWERGSGITKACGTGACATAAAAVEAGIVNECCSIVMDGGSLFVHCNKKSGRISMRGPAVTIFEGEIEI